MTSTRDSDLATVAAVAAGGMLGSGARHGIAQALPTAGSAVPWGTLLVNVSGCLLVGALVAWLEIRPAHRLARPFLGVGVLGGYTTFSAYTVEGRLLASDAGPLVALGYVVGTLAAALLAVRLGGALTRAVVGSGGRHGEAAA